jgi:hypothetical protein
MVGLPYLVSQCAKLHVAGWMLAVSFTRVYLESCISPSLQSGNFLDTPSHLCSISDFYRDVR